MHSRVVGLETEGERVTAAVVEDVRTGSRVVLPADYVFSSPAFL